MSQQIQYSTGQFKSFTAARSFTLGTTGVQISEGSEVLYDGLTARYSGSEIQIPQLRGAIKVGWLVPSEFSSGLVGKVAPVQAGIKIRKADGGNPLEPNDSVKGSIVQSEEREVADLKTHVESVKQRNAASRYKTASGAETAPGTETQESIPVRGLKTPAKQKTSLEDKSYRKALNEANDLKIEPGTGRTLQSVLEGMSEEERESYLSEISARKAARVGVVAKITPSGVIEKEGMKVSNSSGNGVEITDLGGTGGVGSGQIEVVESEGIKFTVTKTPKSGKVKSVDKPVKVKTSKDLDVPRRIAKAICHDFPDSYDFGSTTSKKIAQLRANYGGRPDVIRAVVAAEPSAEVKTKLVNTFPEAFA